MNRSIFSMKFPKLLLLIVMPGWVCAQDLGESLDTTGAGQSLEAPVHNASMIKSALSSPIDSAAIYTRLSNLKGDSGNPTRGAREAQIYSSLSPAVVLVLTNEGFGSGSLIDSTGTILTNWHVIQGHKTAGVVFKPKVEGNAVEFDSAIFADVIKIDEVADLALLRVRELPSGINSIPLGSMTEVAIGSDVHAIGHPTGESWTYTRGFVSQFRKAYEWSYDDAIEHKSDVIQTQTPINPGNSGGPLISSSGHLVGVNSFKASGEALNFAVSIDEVNRFLKMDSDRIAERPAPTRPASCGDQPTGTYRSDDGNSTVSYYDIDCDGEADARFTEPDDPSKAAFISVDEDGDGDIDMILVDQDRDGDIDYSEIDVTGNGKPDLRGHYRDGEDEPYWMEKLT